MSYFFSEVISGVFQSSPDLYCLAIDFFTIALTMKVFRWVIRISILSPPIFQK